MATHAQSEFNRLSGLRKHREPPMHMSQKTHFEISSAAIFIGVALWIAGLTWIAHLVGKWTY